MFTRSRLLCGVLIAVSLCFAGAANAQSFKVQCPTHTALHPLVDANGAPNPGGDLPADATYKYPNPHIKCQQLSGGDGFATMADGTQTYLFAFGPLSGLADLVKGQAGTQTPTVFNQDNLPVLDAIKIGAPWPDYAFNGAIGLVPDVEANNGGGVANAPLNGHVDARLIMDVGVLNGSMPAPLIVIEEGDELFLTLTNVGQVMRPDLFEQHTVHFHGYANASPYFDGVPDASVAINVGGSFTYYYLAPEPGTYMWHCHVTPPEHLQMGMVGQIYVRPRQNSTLPGANLHAALAAQQSDAATKCDNADVLCSNQLPSVDNGATRQASHRYAYNDGDGSTRYDVEYPIQLMGFDPNYHFVSMTFNPASFAENKDKYFLINGRGYPDTVNPNPIKTQASDGVERYSQPMSSVINIPAGGRALLRITDLNITEFHTLASLGMRMHVIGANARLLRDQDGNNMDYFTNSITLGGGESVDVILDATGYEAGQKFYLYSRQLDHLANDAENFGGMMTEINICGAVDPVTKQCT